MKALCILFLVVLTLGVAPAAVWADPYHALEPGSVLIFHKFLRGTVDSGDGTRLPASAFEISVVCPPDAPLGDLDPACTDAVTGMPKQVTLAAHWICPPQPTTQDHYCSDTDFVLKTTVGGTLWINPENIPGTGIGSPQGPDPIIPAPLCPAGFLIVYVVNGPTTRNPISYNGLIGDAVLRQSDITEVTAYEPVSIQSPLPTLALTEGTGQNFLGFDDFVYEDLTDRVFGSVRYDDPGRGIQTFITLLTPDVDSNTNSTGDANVGLDFLDANETFAASTAADVICWKEVELTTDLNSGLTASNIGTAKGLVKITNNSGDGILALITTVEAIPPSSPFFRAYTYSTFKDLSTQDSGGDYDEFGNSPFAAPAVPLAPALPGAPVAAAPTAPAPAPAPAPSPSPLPLPLPSLPTLH